MQGSSALEIRACMMFLAVVLHHVHVAPLGVQVIPWEIMGEKFCVSWEKFFVNGFKVRFRKKIFCELLKAQ